MFTTYTDEYYLYLIDLIDCDEHLCDRYTKLFELLFNAEFTIKIGNDQNRASDGLGLREDFLRECGSEGIYYIDGMPHYCTVLEMMIALAHRWERDVMYDPVIGDRTYEWFWLMMKNSGLDLLTDDEFNEDMANDILKFVLERRYDRSGKGGFFYTTNPAVDMRKTELWYQINYFFGENYA